jgi:hypothetical protein
MNTSNHQFTNKNNTAPFAPRETLRPDAQSKAETAGEIKVLMQKAKFLRRQLQSIERSMTGKEYYFIQSLTILIARRMNEIENEISILRGEPALDVWEISELIHREAEKMGIPRHSPRYS